MIQLKKYSLLHTPIIDSGGLFAYQHNNGSTKPKMRYYSDLTHNFVAYPFWIKQQFYSVGGDNAETER